MSVTTRIHRGRGPIGTNLQSLLPVLPVYEIKDTPTSAFLGGPFLSASDAASEQATGLVYQFFPLSVGTAHQTPVATASTGADRHSDSSVSPSVTCILHLYHRLSACQWALVASYEPPFDASLSLGPEASSTLLHFASPRPEGVAELFFLSFTPSRALAQSLCDAVRLAVVGLKCASRGQPSRPECATLQRRSNRPATVS
ncbi:unnamed protein product [Protopolystoma xenopodis]|uniref:Uncharacterized protein n=1 Tax=Protopolystoma xenopodis TaxID=117903 RepID=A0A3S5ADG6_9PLAT|nr:unnamed protein product [Protopolystoma xenopodis]